MLGSKRELESLCGKAVDLIAYPYGSYNESTGDRARASGFSAGFTTQPRSVNEAKDRFGIGRVMVTNQTNLSRIS